MTKRVVVYLTEGLIRQGGTTQWTSEANVMIRSIVVHNILFREGDGLRAGLKWKGKIEMMAQFDTLVLPQISSSFVLKLNAVLVGHKLAKESLWFCLGYAYVRQQSTVICLWSVDLYGSCKNKTKRLTKWYLISRASCPYLRSVTITVQNKCCRRICLRNGPHV